MNVSFRVNLPGAFSILKVVLTSNATSPANELHPVAGFG
jgi:hypothetical protein